MSSKSKDPKRSTNSEAPKQLSKPYKRALLKGTFDRFHIGHELLSSMPALSYYFLHKEISFNLFSELILRKYEN